jgi:SAM-dependent methyltransferase
MSASASGWKRGSLLLYRRVLSELIKSGQIDLADRVLVSCGGSSDAEVLRSLNFSNVTISNLDQQYTNSIAPFAWERQDAENLTHANDEFDISIVHAGLHHCYSPHRALLEMYRVSRKAVIVFEARDSLALNVAKSAGLTPDYEIEAVSAEGYESGGAGNGPVPNFIYRWTESEVLKTIRSFDPAREPDIRFYYGLMLPSQRFEKTNRPFLRAALKVLTPVATIISTVLPKQGNQFAFIIFKREALQPWLQKTNEGELRLSRAWTESQGRNYVR